MTQSFLHRLDDIKSKTNRNKEDQAYISKKRNEFSKLYDISKEKRIKELEIPEYIVASPSKKTKNDDESDNEIPDLDENDVKEEVVKETDVDKDDPDWEFLEEEENDDEEFENPKKRRSHFHFPRLTAAALRFGISTFALTVMIWAYNMGKKIFNS